jgi:tetratricopeptide (TPR) repeat protein
MAAAHPFTGYGLETFSTEFPRSESLALARAYPDFYHESPHNVLIDALFSQGLPGFAALVAFLCLGAAAARYAAPPDKTFAAILLGGFVASAISQQFFSFTVSTSLCFYVVLAALLSTYDRSLTVAAPIAFRAARVSQRYALRMAAVVCGLTFFIYGVRLLVADHYLAAVRDKLALLEVPAAIAEYKRASDWLPPGPTADLYYSRALAAAAASARDPLSSIQAWQQAIEAGIRAPRTTDEPANAAYSLAMLYAAKNDPAGVESSLRAAIQSAPNWFKPHWMLARVLALQGRLKEANLEADAAIERNGGKNQEVLETLQEIRKRLAEAR